jgi:hypothetical protein
VERVPPSSRLPPPYFSPLVKPFRSLYTQTTRTGIGLLAARPFARGKDITRISGRVYHWRVLLRRGGSFLANCFRYSEDTYLDPGDGPGRYLNHSCDPNAGIRKEARALYLFAARRIRAGEEIVIDYSTITGDDDAWRMYCRCGSPKCRRWVGRFGLLPAGLRKSLLERGLVPSHVRATLD